MNVYQRVLSSIFEASGGKDSADVEFSEILKKEGFLPSFDDIHTHLSKQGWITDSSRPRHVRITHWGIQESRKLIGGGSATLADLAKSTNRLKSEAGELQRLTADLSEDVNEAKLKQIDKQIKLLGDISAEIRALI